MNACPNCRTVLEEDVPLCPNCGARMMDIADLPHKDTHRENGCLTGCLLTGLVYFFLAPLAFMDHLIHNFPRGYPNTHRYAVFRYGTWPINLAPLVIVGGLYLLLRRRYPLFARGLSYSLIGIGVLLLWGLATCRY